MRTLLSTILLSLVFNSTLAQNTFWAKPDYGLTFDLNLPIIKPVSKDTLSMKSAVGASVFFEFGNSENLRLQTSLGFDRVVYNHNELLSTITNNSVNMGFTGFYQPGFMDGTKFFFGIEPSYTLTEVDAYDVNQVPVIRKSDELDNPFDIGFRVGMSLILRPHIALNLSYKEMYYGKPQVNRYKGVPDQFEVGLQFKFNRISSRTQLSNRIVAKHEVSRMKDSSYLIFILNSHAAELRALTDEGDRKDLLEKIEEEQSNQIAAIKENYKFSNYIICKETELPKILTGNFNINILGQSAGLQSSILGTVEPYFARIGEFPIYDNQSPRSGIFIYDNQMNLLVKPFPSYTPYYGLETFLSDEKRLNAMINTLNESLDLLYWANQEG